MFWFLGNFSMGVTIEDPIILSPFKCTYSLIMPTMKLIPVVLNHPYKFPQYIIYISYISYIYHILYT